MTTKVHTHDDFTVYEDERLQHAMIGVINGEVVMNIPKVFADRKLAARQLAHLYAEARGQTSLDNVVEKLMRAYASLYVESLRPKTIVRSDGLAITVGDVLDAIEEEGKQ